MVFAHKNNVDKLVETVRKELKEIRAYLSEEAKTGGEKEKERVEQLDVAITLGEKAGRWSAVEKIRDAINNDPSKFIRSLKDLKFDSSYSDDLFNEYRQVKNKSSVKQIKTSVDVVRRLHLAKDIGAQEQTFIDKIDYVKIKDVVASSTEAELLWRNVWLPAFAKGSIAPADAKEILQDALDKLTSPNWQTQSVVPGNNQEKTPGGAAGTPGEAKKEGEKTPGEAKNETPESLEAVIYAKKGVASELLEERSKREKYIIKKFITSIKEPDTESLQKANAAILQFSAESQAILKKVALSKEEIKQLQAIQNDLNKAVEDKAKELNVGTQTLTVSEKHLEATTKHIENLMKIKEEEYEKVIEQAITDYHNQVIEIFEELGIPKENIDETLKQRIKRHRELGKLLRKIPNGEESNQQTPIRGFLPNGQTSTDTPK